MKKMNWKYHENYWMTLHATWIKFDSFWNWTQIQWMKFKFNLKNKMQIVEKKIENLFKNMMFEK
jgi:hypothetical protein